MNIPGELRIDISLLTTSDFKRAESLSSSEKSELLGLLKYSYPHFESVDIFDHYPCYKQLYVFRLRLNNTLVASRQFLIVDDLSKAPGWAIEINDILQNQSFAIGSRAIIHPHLHGQGLGSKLVSKVNTELYTGYDAEAIYGASSNMGAIALYLQHGAKLWKDDIKKLNREEAYRVNNTSLEELFDKSHSCHSRMLTKLRYVYRKNVLNNDRNEKLNHLIHFVTPPQSQSSFNDGIVLFPAVDLCIIYLL
jgi:GNAT superfamily N-acetyltransferase